MWVGYEREGMSFSHKELFSGGCFFGHRLYNLARTTVPYGNEKICHFCMTRIFRRVDQKTWFYYQNEAQDQFYQVRNTNIQRNEFSRFYAESPKGAFLACPINGDISFSPQHGHFCTTRMFWCGDWKTWFYHQNEGQDQYYLLRYANMPENTLFAVFCWKSKRCVFALPHGLLSSFPSKSLSWVATCALTSSLWDCR